MVTALEVYFERQDWPEMKPKYDQSYMYVPLKVSQLCVRACVRE